MPARAYATTTDRLPAGGSDAWPQSWKKPARQAPRRPPGARKSRHRQRFNGVDSPQIYKEGYIRMRPFAVWVGKMKGCTPPEVSCLYPQPGPTRPTGKPGGRPLSEPRPGAPGAPGGRYRGNPGE